MVIQVSKSKLFYQYLLWLDPILHLTKIERSILASMLTLHFFGDRSKELMGIINSEEALNEIRKKLRLGKRVFAEGVNNLREKGYLDENGVAPLFTSYPKDNKFNINVEFKYE